MRAGPQLRVAKAARAPPCTLPILGRRFHSPDELLYFLKFFTTFPAHNLNESVNLTFLPLIILPFWSNYYRFL